MDEDKLHPTIQEFKSFLKKHPKLIEDVRKNGKSWQEHYEKWVLLGEDDPVWAQYKPEEPKEKKGRNKEKQTELFAQLMKLTENVDLNKVQGQVQQLSSTIATVQELLGQFQQSKKTPTGPATRSQPFHWFRD